MKTTDNKTGHAIIQLSSDGQNSILLYGGANQCIDEQFINDVLSDFESGDYLVVQNEISCMPKLIDEAINIGMKIFLNPSPFTDELLSFPIEKIDTIIMNEVEGMQFTGEKSPDAIVDNMRKKYPNTNILLTLGSKGSLYVSSEERCFVSAVMTTVVDTTGAGDTFTGYFIGSLSKGYKVAEAQKIATLAASIAVGELGAACSIPSWDVVAKLISDIYPHQS